MISMLPQENSLNSIPLWINDRLFSKVLHVNLSKLDILGPKLTDRRRIHSSTNPLRILSQLSRAVYSALVSLSLSLSFVKYLTQSSTRKEAEMLATFLYPVCT
jgi:hypothetical protein